MGGFGTCHLINTEPRLPGNRKLGYLYQINVGVERQILNGMAVTADYRRIMCNRHLRTFPSPLIPLP